MLCHNHLGSLDEVACVMKHELIHAYDQCTAKGLNWADVDDRACSEVCVHLNGLLVRASIDLGCIWSQHMRAAHDNVCVQIRAAALSGDCSRGMELLRGNWRLRGQYQTCIKRRAALSIVDACPGGQEEAEAVVGRNFETCFQDTRPFATHPNQ